MEVDIFARAFFQGFSSGIAKAGQECGGLPARPRYSRWERWRSACATTPIKEDSMDRTANAVWKGNLKEGKGTLDTQSGDRKSVV